MTRKACTFRQRDLAAALRAAKQAGQPVREVLIDPADGKLRILFGEPVPAEPTEPTTPTTNPAKQVWLDLARKRSTGGRNG